MSIYIIHYYNIIWCNANMTLYYVNADAMPWVCGKGYKLDDNS